MKLLSSLSFALGSLMALTTYASTSVSTSYLKDTNEPIHYKVEHGLAIYQGDIILGKVSDVEKYGLCLSSSGDHIVICGNQLYHNSQLDNRWPEGVVPYEISADYPASQVQSIKNAMKRIMERTHYRVKFVARVGQQDYLKIKKQYDCSSYVGQSGGLQSLYLDTGCVTPRIIKHELMHALGFPHEQSRRDRDRYVTIEWENIRWGKADNFSRIARNTVYFGPYDYGSIMHYALDAFTNNLTKKTIIPIRDHTIADDEIGTRSDLSTRDVLAVDLAYDSLGKKCPNNSTLTGDKCLVERTMPATSQPFEHNDYLYIKIGNRAACPSNTVDEGTASDGRRCNTGIKLEGRLRPVVQENSLFVTPYFEALRCPEHTQYEGSCLIVKRVSGLKRIIVKDGHLAVRIGKSFHCPDGSTYEGDEEDQKVCKTQLQVENTTSVYPLHIPGTKNPTEFNMYVLPHQENAAG